MTSEFSLPSSTAFEAANSIYEHANAHRRGQEETVPFDELCGWFEGAMVFATGMESLGELYTGSARVAFAFGERGRVPLHIEQAARAHRGR